MCFDAAIIRFWVAELIQGIKFDVAISVMAKNQNGGPNPPFSWEQVRLTATQAWNMAYSMLFDGAESEPWIGNYTNKELIPRYVSCSVL